MRCPKCQFDHPLQTTECLKCGIIFSRYQPAPEQTAIPHLASHPSIPVSLAPSARTAERDDAVTELRCRALALPIALLAAWLLTATGFRMVAGMLAMVLHESGHAIAAWLTGRWAIPLLWVTSHGEERSWAIILLLASSILLVGFLAWKTHRWGWLAAAGALFLLQIVVLCSQGAGALIVFWGDGGALVLATLLMALFYAPRESAFRKSWGLRWGLLFLGALSFMHVFRVWTGPFEDIPFGEIEGVNLSDPSLLTEMYGWPVPLLIHRYIFLGELCLAFLFILYLAGLLSSYLQVRHHPANTPA